MLLVYLVATKAVSSWGRHPKSPKVGHVNSVNYNKLCSCIKEGALINNGWKRPSEGVLMINIGVAFEETRGSGSTGAVIKDSSGGFIVASHSYISHVVDAAMAEMSALRDGLLLAQQLGRNRVEFQSDCMEVSTM